MTFSTQSLSSLVLNPLAKKMIEETKARGYYIVVFNNIAFGDSDVYRIAVLLPPGVSSATFKIINSSGTQIYSEDITEDRYITATPSDLPDDTYIFQLVIPVGGGNLYNNVKATLKKITTTPPYILQVNDPSGRALVFGLTLYDHLNKYWYNYPVVGYVQGATIFGLSEISSNALVEVYAPIDTSSNVVGKHYAMFNYGSITDNTTLIIPKNDKPVIYAKFSRDDIETIYNQSPLNYLRSAFTDFRAKANYVGNSVAEQLGLIYIGYKDNGDGTVSLMFTTDIDPALVVAAVLGLVGIIVGALVLSKFFETVQTVWTKMAEIEYWRYLREQAKYTYQLAYQGVKICAESDNPEKCLEELGIFVKHLNATPNMAINEVSKVVKQDTEKDIFDKITNLVVVGGGIVLATTLLGAVKK